MAANNQRVDMIKVLRNQRFAVSEWADQWLRNIQLKIRNEEFEFDDLMQMVEDKMEHIKAAYAKSVLPDRPDIHIAESLLVQIRKSFYGN